MYLCGEDEALISRITVQLYCREEAATRSACRELRVSILADFPPELVLQKPSLFHALLALLSAPFHGAGAGDLDGGGGGGDSVGEVSLQALEALGGGLRRSLRLYCQDSACTPRAYSVAQARGSASQLSREEARRYPSLSRSEAVAEGVALPQACYGVLMEVLPLLRSASKAASAIRVARSFLQLYVQSCGPSHGAAQLATLAEFATALEDVLRFHGASAAADPVLSNVHELALEVRPFAPACSRTKAAAARCREPLSLAVPQCTDALLGVFNTPLLLAAAGPGAGVGRALRAGRAARRAAAAAARAT